MRTGNWTIERIAMLSTHGYFDPIPQLGRTDTGGQVVYVLQLSKALTVRNMKVDIYTRWFDRSKDQIAPIPGCTDARVIRIPAGPWEFIPKEEIYDILPELTNNMVHYIQDNSFTYDLFHGHYVDAGIVTIDVAKEFDKPSFFTAHSLGAWKREQMCGDSEEMENKYKFEHRVSEEQRIFRSVRAQTVTTEVQKEKLAQLYGFTADNIEVISPGVDVHTFRPLRSDEKRPATDLPDRYVFCLSRIDCNKGHDLLLEAFDIVRKEIPHVHLVIGGGSQKPEQREKEVLGSMNRIIEEKDMAACVHIIGYVPDDLLVQSYQQAELFVLPSIFEPFGMTALEAMACGTPVVASRFGGIRNVISSGENGLLVDPSDKGQFAETMALLLRDKQLSVRLGRLGCQTIHSYFSWEAIAEKHVAFYKRYMSR